MGLIRKTLSVGTFGTVAFRGKKERLRRAERSIRDAEASLQKEHGARVSAENRVTAAEKRVKRAGTEAESAAKRLEQSKRRNRRHGKGETMGDVFAGLEPMLRSGVESARSATVEAVEQGQKVGRRARKAAKRSLQNARASTSS